MPRKAPYGLINKCNHSYIIHRYTFKKIYNALKQDKRRGR